MSWEGGLRAPITFVGCILCAALGHAQIPLATAVTLAVKNSPQIKLAQDDVHRAIASVSEIKGAYIPSIVANGGAGDSYGITLSVPTIFTLNAQSLVYSAAQRVYARAVRLSLQAANFTLEDVRERVEEDAVLTYLNLEHLRETALRLETEEGDTVKLQMIVQKRFEAGLDTGISLNQARLQVLQIRLRRLQTEDERTTLRTHLSGLTGEAPTVFITSAEPIPPFKDSLPDDQQHVGVSASEQAASANAQAKLLRAKGDSLYRWHPQIAFTAQYGRVSPINGASSYYNLQGQYNTGFAGVQIQFPLFDRARQARNVEAAADASHAEHDLVQLQAAQKEEQVSLTNSLDELSLGEQIAEVESNIAEDQLQSTLRQVRDGGNGGIVLNPEDEQNARLKVDEHRLELLDATYKLQRARVSMLRKTGNLETWLGLRLTMPVASPR